MNHSLMKYAATMFFVIFRAVKYDPLKKVHVWFVGEEGSYTEGLTREMWRLFGIEV